MALPQALNTATPAASDSPSGAPALFQNIKQFIVDVFGITDNTAYNVKGFSIDPTTGVVTMNVAGFAVKSIALTQGTLTADAQMISGTVTWNDVASTFTAWKLAVTSTASAAASKLLDLQVASASVFTVRKDGSITVGIWAGTTLATGVGGTGLTGTATSGQLLIGNGAGYTLATITGTANQVLVTNGAGTITLATPQSINTGATPTFASLSLTATSNQLVLQSAGITGTISWTPTVSGKTLTLPNLTGTAMLIDGGQTVTSGIWQGTKIGTLYGGTNQDTSGSTGVPSVSAGTWSVAARLQASLGGTAIDTSGSTGVPTISAGTWSVAAQLSALRGGTAVDGSAAGNGKLLIGNGTGYTLANITAGFKLAITNASGAITIAEYAPEDKVVFFDDFFSADANSAGGSGAARVFGHNWFVAGTTGVQALSSVAYLKCSGDASSNGQAALTRDGSGAALNTFAVTSKNPEIRIRHAQFSTGAGTRRVGLASDKFNAGDPTDGIFFRHAVGGAISLVCRASSVESTLATGVTAAQDTFHTYRVVVTGTTSADLYVDGASIGSITTNIPTANMTLAVDAGGTSATSGLWVDYFYCAQDR